VDHFARRFQVQEKLTREIAEHLQEALAPRGLGVVMRGEHLCMAMRGVRRENCTTTTSSMLGVFRDNAAARGELLELMKEGR